MKEKREVRKGKWSREQLDGQREGCRDERVSDEGKKEGWNQ